MTAAIFIRQSAQDWGGSRYLQWRIRAISWVAVDIFSRQSITEIGCMVIAIFSRQSTHGIEVAIAVISTQSTYTYRVGLRIVVIATFNKADLPRGGHWPRKGVWGCAALKTPFSRLSCRSQGSHFKQKSQFTRPPFEKFGNFSLYSLNFHPNFSSQAPKFGNFQLTSPQIWKFSAHKPPNLEIFRSQAPLFRGKCQFASRTLQKSGPHTPTRKKSWVPPLGDLHRRGVAVTIFSKHPTRL